MKETLQFLDFSVMKTGVTQSNEVKLKNEKFVLKIEISAGFCTILHEK